MCLALDLGCRLWWGKFICGLASYDCTLNMTRMIDVGDIGFGIFLHGISGDNRAFSYSYRTSLWFRIYAWATFAAGARKIVSNFFRRKMCFSGMF